VEHREAADLAAELLARWGLEDWRFEFDHAVRRFGHCRFDARTISLSRHLVALNERAAVEDTILHEIAHALAGPRHGHDAVWRRTALRVGARPDRTFGNEVASPPARWVGTCPGCGGRLERHRLLRRTRQLACAACGRGRWHRDFVYQWRRP
jgi:predicted SprT family Zn-dependent metalloprotease